MSMTLWPAQITGNLTTTAHDMLYTKQNLKKPCSSVFGKGYFDLSSPAKTFRTRNLSMAHNSNTTKMKPMRVKETLSQMTTGFNYSHRKFVLQSDKQVDRLMPSDLSVANLMHQKVDEHGRDDHLSQFGSGIMSSIDINGYLQQRSYSLAGAAAMMQKVSSFAGQSNGGLKLRNRSLPPQMMMIRSPGADAFGEESLPELNATRAKIEQHIYKSPLRNQNVSILISRNSRNNDTALTSKTPSYMRDQSQTSFNNQDIIHAESNASLPAVPHNLKLKSHLIQISNHMEPRSSENVVKAKFPVRSKLFELQTTHISPRELLQEKLIERAVEKHASHLRAGTDLDKLKELSKLTMENRRAQLALSPARRDHQVPLIFSPKAMGSSLTPMRQTQLNQVGNISSIGFGFLANIHTDDSQQKQTFQQAVITKAEQLQTVDQKGEKQSNEDIEVLTPQQQQSTDSPTRSKRSPTLKKGDRIYHKSKIDKKPSKLHQTVTHVPSPQFSKNEQSPKESTTSRLMDTRDKFMDTQKIPFRRTSKLSNQHPSQEQKFDTSQIMIKGSSGRHSIEGNDTKMIQKNERDAFNDFARTGQSNMGIKLDPDMVHTKTSIKINDIDFNKQRAKLKITKSRAKSGDSEEDEIISKDSQPKDDEGEDDYYEEMQLRSKLKPKQKKNKSQPIEDNVETEGKNSNMDKTLSSIGKNMRLSAISRTRFADPGTRLYQNEKDSNGTPISPRSPTHLPLLSIKGQEIQISRIYEGSPSMMLKRNKKSVVIKDRSRGALTIMNVTFNDEIELKKSRFGKTKKGTENQKKPFGTTAFHISSKKRFERIQQLNEEMKEKAYVPENPSPLRGRDSKSILESSNHGANTSNANFLNTKSDKFQDPINSSAGKISPLNSLNIQGNPQWRQDQNKSIKKDETQRPNKIKISLQQPASFDQVRAETQLKVQGNEATLQRRPDSKHNMQIDSQVSLKILIQSKPSRDDIHDQLGRTQQGLKMMGEGASSMTVDQIDQVADDIKSILDDELFDDLESPSPLKLNKPTLNIPQPIKQSTKSNVRSSKQQPSPLSSRAQKIIVPVKIGSRKRKSALEKTNGGVEPWNNKEVAGKKQQSMLSFADLQNDSDDNGPVIKNELSDTQDFMLKQDASVQQLKAQHLSVRSSLGEETVPKTSQAQITTNTNKSSKKA